MQGGGEELVERNGKKRKIREVKRGRVKGWGESSGGGNCWKREIIYEQKDDHYGVLRGKGSMGWKECENPK